MNYVRLSFLIFLVVLISACSAVDVKHKYDRNYDFTHYNTYKFIEGKEGVEGFDHHVKKSINRELALKGFGINRIYYDFIVDWSYENNLFTIKILDEASESVVWKGWAEELVNPTEGEISEAVEEILYYFPPRTPGVFKGD